MRDCWFDYQQLKKPEENLATPVRLTDADLLGIKMCPSSLPASGTLEEYNVLTLCSLLNFQYLTLNSRVELLESVRNRFPRLTNHLAAAQSGQLIAAYSITPRSKGESCPSSEL